ncbi:hypothetical protein F8388_001312 [Cannabis sativa]|uniref:glutaredoxin-dependent peroxiredoxin n=1 Tax=Cannabis sativa TaxID=3483 RepID=A0A7J6DVK8_CANSA|nr:hypothetical protein F8388_001312 [Cannabis sativa]
MASSVNNIAATFSKLSKTTSSSSSSSSTPHHHQTNFPLTVSLNPISTSWNPHATIPKSQRSSLLNLYGPPGPPPTILPFSSTSTVHPRRPMIDQNPKKLPVVIGKKLPSNIALSYLNRNGVVQAVSLSSLCKGRKVVVVGISAAFTPGCSRFVKRVELAKSNGWDLIACVGVNDVHVMRAWGEQLGVGQKVMMLSDGGGELARGLGVSLDPTSFGSKANFIGLGVRPKRFWLNTINGVITAIDFDNENDGFVSSK